MRSLGSRRNWARRAFRHEMGTVAHRKNVGVSGRLQCGGNDELVVATDSSPSRAARTAGPFTPAAHTTN